MRLSPPAVGPGLPSEAAGVLRLLRLAGTVLRLPVSAAPVATACMVVLSLAQGLLPVAGAWSLKVFLDSLAAAGPERRAGLLAAAAGFAVAGLAGSLIVPVTGYLGQHVGRLVTVRVQSDLFERTNRFVGLRPFEDPAIQDRLQLAEYGGTESPGQLVQTATTLVQGAAQTAGWVVALMAIWPPIVPLALVVLVPVVLIRMRIGRHIAEVAATVNPLLRRAVFFRTLLTDPTAAKELRLFDLGEFLRGRLVGETTRAHAHQARLDRRMLRVELGMALCAMAGTVATIGAAVHLALDGRLTVGDVSVFLAAAGGLQSTALAAIRNLGDGYTSLVSFAHYHAVLRLPPDLPDGQIAPAALAGGITLRDVWFRYHENAPWVLRGVSLHIPAGTTAGLVGVNGAGKSTLVKLLCRLYDPQRGQILWDGVDLRELSSRDLRRRMSVVFQDFMAYDLTAAENIAVGDLTALHDTERIRAAAATVGVDDALCRLPAGYRTLLSRTFAAEDDAAAGGLSGGQWQRLALARAVLRDDADLLILDEPTAGLDPEAEAALAARLRTLNRGRTRLLISHRLNALRDADLIVVLADGRVQERGSHAELTAARGVYARLFSLQAAGYGEASAPVVPTGTPVEGMVG